MPVVELVGVDAGPLKVTADTEDDVEFDVLTVVAGDNVDVYSPLPLGACTLADIFRLSAAGLLRPPDNSGTNGVPPVRNEKICD